MKEVAAGQTVSVVIPCFDQARFLPAAIESALAQTVGPAEVIVVDDGSTQEISEVASSYPGVELVSRPRGGPSAARNSGLEAAGGDKVVFLDSDDILFPNAIGAGLTAFARCPEAAFVYGAAEHARGETVEVSFWPVRTHEELLECNWVGMIAAVMFDRRKLLDSGGFDEGLRMCEDWELFLRLSRKFGFEPHDEVIARYVRHEASATNDLHELWKWVRLVRAKEEARGLDAPSRRAWSRGEGTWRSLIGPDPKDRSQLRRAISRIKALLQ